MATYQRGFKLGILPERKIDRRALATSYAFLVLMVLLLINIGLLFPDRISLKQYRVTELIPLPALEAGAGTHQNNEARDQAEAASCGAGFRAAQADRAAGSSSQCPATGGGAQSGGEPVCRAAVQDGAAGGARPQLLHTGDFAGSSVAPTVNAAVEKVQTGGFGDPNGLKGTGKQGAKLYAAQAGGFDMPVGPGQGNGSGGAKGIKGTVASADFGNGVATAARRRPQQRRPASQPADSDRSRWFTAARRLRSRLRPGNHASGNHFQAATGLYR